MNDTISNIVVTTISGEAQALADYAGQVLLIVNVASRCGYTPQYEGLEALYRQYSAQGFQILGFPCNDFGAQEPGSNDEIMAFCRTTYGVTFPMFAKVHVKGAEQHPLYALLTQAVEPKGEVGWNFEKFLVNKTGQPVARFRSSVSPQSWELSRMIEQALAA